MELDGYSLLCAQYGGGRRRADPEELHLKLLVRGAKGLESRGAWGGLESYSCSGKDGWFKLIKFSF